MKMQGIQNSQNIGKEEKIWSAHISQFESYKGIIKTTKDWHKDKHMTNGTELKAQKYTIILMVNLFSTRMPR